MKTGETAADEGTSPLGGLDQNGMTKHAKNENT